MSASKTVLREAIADPTSVARPLVHPETRVWARPATGLRSWLLTATLFLIPLLTYWPATFHDYGLRDDYSNLREAHEEPGVVVRFCASHARPIYGWLLQNSFGATSSVQNLRWMRVGAALLLGAIGLVMFRGLSAYGWSFNSSLCFAVLLELVPSAQVIAGWAIGWPYAATALLAMAGFFTVESALCARPALGMPRAAGQWATAIVLMVVSALIYQPSAMFYLVPLTGALIAQRRGAARTVRWLGLHCGLLMGSLAIAYGIMSGLYAAGIFVKSGRIAFEHHWGEKLAWFLRETLPNGLSLWVLNDNNLRDHGMYLACAGMVGMLLLAGLYLEWKRYGRLRGLVWAGGLFFLPVLAAGVSLVASERYATYRTIFAMTAVLLCFLVASLRSLSDHWQLSSRRLLAVLAVAVSFFIAQHHVYALIAVPQGNEWQLILSGAKRVQLNAPSRPKVFAIASSPSDISTDTIYHDEFGSLSSNSEWVPKEMFKRAMHDLHPNVPNLESRYEFAEGYKLPSGQHYDVIIDMHQLRRFHTDN